MTKSEILSAVSRIKRAPNVTLLMRAVDAVLGSNAMGIARIGARWEVSEGGFAIYQADFATVRRRLASYVMDACSCDEADEPAEQTAAVVSQPTQIQQACAAPRVAMRLVRTVTTHGIVAVSVGPCPEFPDHGRDEYRVTTDGDVVRTRYVLANDHYSWSSPGARPFITPNRSPVTARRTIDAVAECLAAAPAMTTQPCQQQQARDRRSPTRAAPTQSSFDAATVAQGDSVSRLLDGLLREDAPGDLAQALVTVHAASAHLNSANVAYTASPSKASLASQWRARFMHLQALRHYDVLLEIDAIGHLQMGYGLRPCLEGIAVLQGDEMLFHVPLGTERRGIETALRIYADAFSAGREAGRAAAMADFRAFIGEPA
ncbi:hypothetical protein ASF49_15935 [Methylobacterium sp. Leaf104]|uniref:hypothetical protein n=1 Tax=Methylobacterium TaxID=407 RepID=UPI000700E61D|nr:MULTISPECIES: hypothetical protein [Methylobacterium]KQP29648.1 hypothetical protein ASF49_15935 [Methylobacterium sp. Leaf104]KQQ24154.1 hypothetical protein ASF58_16360 [Methylobacterium sp. Leaf125]MCI9881804.1 hypothetical protein [Methylobacterium goesingense]